MIKPVFILIALVVGSQAQIRANILPQGDQVWPQPKSLTTTQDGADLIISEVEFAVDAGTPSIYIEQAFTIYKELIPVSSEGGEKV